MFLFLFFLQSHATDVVMNLFIIVDIYRAIDKEIM